MSLNKLFVLIISFALFSTLSFSHAQSSSRTSRPQGKAIEMVLAVLDGEPITMADVKSFLLSSQSVSSQDVYLGKFDVRKSLEELIADKMIQKEAAQAKITANDEDVDSYIKELSRQNRMTEDQFLKEVQSRGISQDKYRERVKEEIIRLRLFGLKVRAKVVVLEDDVQAYLDKNPSLKPTEGSVRIEQISIPLSRFNSVDEGREEMEEMREQAKDGKSFSEVGEKYYKDLGFLSVDDLKDDIREAIKGLEVGEVSEVVQQEKSLDLFKMSEGLSSNSKTVIDDKLKQKIQNELFEERFKRQIDKYIKEELPQKYQVEYKI